MGSWNETCGVSQLSIRWQEPVTVYLMIQSKQHQMINASGTCEGDAYFKPWFLPITGKYNSYGSVEDIQHDWNTEHILSTFQSWVKEDKVRILNGDHEAEINAPNILKFTNIEDIFKCIERGALLFRGHDGIWLKISMFMVLERIHNDMINIINENIDDSDLRCWYKEYKRCKESFILNIATSSQIEYSELLQIFYHGIVSYKHYVDYILKDTISISDFFDKFDNVMKFYGAMILLRKIWMPQTGHGSQAEEFWIHTALSNSILGYIDAKNKQDKEENDDTI